MAKGIYQAFVKYKDKYNKGFTVPYSSPKDNSINIPSIVPDDGNDERISPKHVSRQGAGQKRRVLV